MTAFSENNAMGVLFITILISCLGSLALVDTTGSNLNGTTVPAISGTTLKSNGSKKNNLTVTGPNEQGFDYRKAHLKCRCGFPSVIWSQNIDPEDAEIYYRAKMNAPMASEMKNYSFLTERNCTKCTVHYTTCHGADETYFLNCIRRTVHFSRIPRTYLLKKTRKTNTKTIIKRSLGRTSDSPIAGGFSNFYIATQSSENEKSLDTTSSRVTGVHDFYFDTESSENEKSLNTTSSRVTAEGFSDFYFDTESSENEKSMDTTSSRVTDGKGEFLYRRIINEVQVKTFHSPFQGETGNGTRARRALGGCLIPMLYGDYSSDFQCINEEDFNEIKCIQLCIWGHTLPTGIKKFLNCSEYSKAAWEPHGISACEAFVDCGVQLVSPGLLECSPITVTEGPTCKISCETYENRDFVPEDTYACDINGKWNKELPFCVTRSTAHVLVEPPQKKLHDGLEVPVSSFDYYAWKDLANDL